MENFNFILSIAFNIIAIIAMFVFFSRPFKKQSKPNVFMEKIEECGSPDTGEFTHNIIFNTDGILDSYYDESKRRLEELETTPPLISILKAVSKAANTVKIVNDYKQAIEQENYELAGELHKQIEALKNENTAHNN